MRNVAAAAPGGVLVHCHAGKDRTGLILGLVLALIGVPETIIAEDYAASDTYLQPLYEAMLAEAGRSLADAPITMARSKCCIDYNSSYRPRYSPRYDSTPFATKLLSCGFR